MEHNKIQEGLGDEAHRAEIDHEVQMARADLYKLAKYSIKLHDMLKNISETEGLEGWVQAKITKASDYISSVYHYMDYDHMTTDTGMEEKTQSPYAIGMAQAMKSTGDTPPLKKSTITKAHKIAKSIEKNETYEDRLYKVLNTKVSEKKKNHK